MPNKIHTFLCDFPQVSHFYGLAPLWKRICLLRSSFRLNVFFTFFTSKWGVLSVNKMMSCKIAFPCKCLTTSVTSMWFIFSVNLLVLHKIRYSCKQFVTRFNFTCVWSIASVNKHMLSKTIFRCKLMSTSITPKWFINGMNKYMSGKSVCQ